MNNINIDIDLAGKVAGKLYEEVLLPFPAIKAAAFVFSIEKGLFLCHDGVNSQQLNGLMYLELHPELSSLITQLLKSSVHRNFSIYVTSNKEAHYVAHDDLQDVVWHDLDLEVTTWDEVAAQNPTTTAQEKWTIVEKTFRNPIFSVQLSLG